MIDLKHDQCATTATLIMLQIDLVLPASRTSSGLRRTSAR
jgi:hypothetical protein